MDKDQTPKKRIQIIVQPVDNGYTINCTSSDHLGQNVKSASLIAKTNLEVAEAVRDFVENVFAEPPAPPAA